ncbi:MAG TPA: hypothetical protein VIJ34_01430 [Acidimicrobiales bacterium]
MDELKTYAGLIWRRRRPNFFGLLSTCLLITGITVSSPVLRYIAIVLIAASGSASGYLVWRDEARQRRKDAQARRPVSAAHATQLRSVTESLLESVARRQLPSWSCKELSPDQARRAFGPHFPLAIVDLLAFESLVRTRDQAVWDLIKLGGDQLAQEFSPDPPTGVHTSPNVTVIPSFWHQSALQTAFKEHVRGQLTSTATPFRSAGFRISDEAIAWDRLGGGGGTIVGDLGRSPNAEQALESYKAQLEAWFERMQHSPEVEAFLTSRDQVYEASLTLSSTLQDLRLREGFSGTCWICET